MKIRSTTDCRCKACGTLLAKRDGDGVTIRRGDMQVVITGDSTIAVTCYRCRALNMLASPPAPPPRSTRARAESAA